MPIEEEVNRSEVPQTSLAGWVQVLRVAAAAVFDSGVILNTAAAALLEIPAEPAPSLADWHEFFRSAEESGPPAPPSNGVPRERLEHRYHIRGSDGCSRQLEVTVHPAEGGELWLLQDITARRLAEDKARVFFEHPSDAYFLVDRSGIVDCSATAVQMLGRSREALIGKSVWEFAPSLQPDGLVSVVAGDAYERLARQQGSHRGEWTHNRADGAEIPVELVLTPFDFSGEPGFLVVWRDLTAKRHAAKSLQESEERYRALFENHPLPLWVYHAESLRFLAVNQAAEAFYGFTRAEFLTMSAMDIRPAREAARLMIYMKKADRPQAAGVWRHRKKNGEEVDMDIVVHAVEFGGEPAIVILARDVTERQRAERALEQSNLRLEQAVRDAAAASRAKTEFLATMSHEIRTPMNGVIGMTSLLLQSPLNTEQREAAETIRGSGETLLAIINDILDFSKVEAGAMELEIQPFEVAAVVSDCLDLVRTQARARQLPLISTVQPGVPAVVRGDATRLRQVLANLLGNAVKFTSSGEIEVSVEAAPLPELDGNSARVVLHFSIRDTGIGIPLEKRHRLFQAFSQVDSSTSRRFGGTGLGLAICKRLCSLMGGEIWLEASDRPGATFHFTIVTERVDAATLPVKRAPAASRPAVPLAQQKPLAILLAEDNKVNQLVAKRMLDRLGYRADIAGNGAEAVRAFKQRAYDVILMDVQMPELNGLEATREIRATLPTALQPWIIAMTANVMAGDREMCLAAGMNDYVGKPVRCEDLERALRAIPIPLPATALAAS